MIDSALIIAEIVNQMDNSLKGEYDLTTGRTYFCDTKWSRVGRIITDSLGNEFRIDEIVVDEYVVATPLIDQVPTLVLDGLCFLTAPFYITGTKLATNREWTIAGDHLETKLPLIWLLEIISETGYGKGSTLERDIDARLFFLDETDPAQYYTIDHRRDVVVPMQKMMFEFIATVNRLREFQTIEDFRYRTFSRFGVETDQGVLQNVLDANLSGTSLEVTLSKYKENCKC